MSKSGWPTENELNDIFSFLFHNVLLRIFFFFLIFLFYLYFLIFSLSVFILQSDLYYGFQFNVSIGFLNVRMSGSLLLSVPCDFWGALFLLSICFILFHRVSFCCMLLYQIIFILFYYYPLGAYLFSNKKRKVCGSIQEGW